jgi:tetratricopeptide (TPR) repeat protein
MRRLYLVGLLGVIAAAPLPAQRVKLTVPLHELLARAQADSNDALVHYDAALGLWLDRQYDLAERHLRDAISIDPGFAPAYLALSYMPYARRNKLWEEEDKGKVPPEWQAPIEEAWRFRRRAFLMDPMVDLKPVALMQAPTATFGLSGRQKNVYTYLMNGFGAFWVGDYATASAFFKEMSGGATEDQRKEFASWYLWYEALSAAHNSDFPRAITNVKLLQKREEEDVANTGGASLAFSSANHYRFALATLLDLSGRENEAIPLLEEALTVDAGLYVGHSRLASIYAERKQMGASLEERRRAIAANPDDPALLHDLGEALARSGELLEAYKVLQDARKANPRNARSHYIFGWVAQQLNEKAAAKEAYTTFIAMAPSRFAGQKTEAQTRLAALQ